MNGQRSVQEIRSEARLAALEAAEVVRHGEAVLDHAHRVARAINEKVQAVGGDVTEKARQAAGA
jgi:hypothetical protein